MTKTLLFILILFSLQMAFAQNSTKTIDLIASNWEVAEGAVFEKFDNRETLLLNGQKATLKNVQFTNGSIEVDVYANSKRSFAGIIFRKQDHNMEEVYMRMHKSSQVDAVQYTPIWNNESNWQLFRTYQAQVTFKNAGWNTLRVEIHHQSADVFVNNEKVLTIDQLRTEQSSGQIGLYTLFSNRFSNFRITPNETLEQIKETSQVPVDASIIRQWDITKAKTFSAEVLNFADFSKEEFTTVRTEASGLLPISKYIKKSSSGNYERNTENYIIATTTVETKEAETKLFSFDYSDKIIVYLNGKMLFKGNNAFRAKGVQYMGHMDINTNQLYLPLQKGINKIHCVVIDKANGWGLMAKMK